MSDGYGVKHAVSFSGRHKLGEEAPLFYGLVVAGYDDGSIDAVFVEPVEEGTRFYDDVSSDNDPAKDNVLMDSCPPPFSEVCKKSEHFLLKDGHGQCYAVADLGNLVHGPRSRFTPIEPDYEISDENFELVLDHLRSRKAQRDGAAELRNASVEQAKSSGSGTSGRRKLGSHRTQDDGLDVRDGDVLVGEFMGTGVSDALAPKARDQKREQASKSAGLPEYDDSELKKSLNKPGLPDFSQKRDLGKSGTEYGS